MIHTRRTSPLLRSALVFLFLGFLINLAVTSCIAIWGEDPQLRAWEKLPIQDCREYILARQSEDQTETDASRSRHAWPQPVQKYWTNLPHVPAQQRCISFRHNIKAFGVSYDYFALAVPFLTRLHHLIQYHMTTVGWPLPSYRYCSCSKKQFMQLQGCGVGIAIEEQALGLDKIEVVELPTPAPLDRGIPLNIFFPSSTRILPTQPMFPAVIFNSLFYAILLALLTLIPRAYIRSHRRRSSLCIRCRYNVTDLSCCPECGTIVRASL